MSDEIKKQIDESWKDAVSKEKESPKIKSDDAPMKVNFGLFITGLMMEAVIALGDMENPVTHKKEQNLQHAKILIDTLEMLKEKTKNNLSKDEDEAMSSILYDLRMRFVAKAKEPDKPKS
ncbi:MAG: DUF1844 domain-containing protein [Candidatus Omnitrophota bacterium]|jgi:hypothetical protein|nr:DUF1844 domain-containing protein [Candidatus Omnitrophota bacterium]